MRLAILACSVIIAAACGAKTDDTTVTRTKEEQRAVDSTVGASALPGARGVRGALAASDSAAKRARELDSLSKLP